MSKGLREVRPQLASLWVRYAPRWWPGPGTVWVDVAERRIRPGRALARRHFGHEVVEVAELDDLVYLPPVAAGREAYRDCVLDEARREGVPVLAQKRASEVGDGPVGAEAGDGVEWVVDPLAALLDGRRQDLERLRPGSRVLFPLLPGLTADPEEWSPMLDLLAAAGVSAVYPVAVELDSRQRRWLGRRLRSEGAYRALYHQEAPDSRRFARAAASRGLETLARRPTWSGSERERTNRRAVGQLDLVAELWLLVGRSPARAQSFFRAARKLEEGTFDLLGLYREGNLRVLDWLAGAPGDVVEEVLAGGESQLLGELQRDLLSVE